MKKSIISLFAVCGLCSNLFAGNVFLQFGNNYDVNVATNYSVNVSSLAVVTVDDKISCAWRAISNPHAESVYYGFNNDSNLELSGIPIYSSSTVILPYYGNIYLKRGAGSATRDVRIGYITIK